MAGRGEFCLLGLGLYPLARCRMMECMEIRIESLIEGARRAKGTVVIIDVFGHSRRWRGTGRRAERIVMVAQPAEACG